ncbi:hypothetical protein SDC9_151271 [bioreactor metagenome]|uniref:Uncharacterized protein n=1 Tax=bioreactor metagenome TaxID=1076179 RepID=A0A645EPT8_9ZZZZ
MRSSSGFLEVSIETEWISCQLVIQAIGQQLDHLLEVVQAFDIVAANHPAVDGTWQRRARPGVGRQRNDLSCIAMNTLPAAFNGVRFGIFVRNELRELGGVLGNGTAQKQGMTTLRFHSH